MIIIRIDEGLGNQMFQYAAGLSVAARTGSVLKIDASAYGQRHNRNFGLNEFCITNTDQASQREIDVLKKENFFYKVKNRVLPVSQRTIFKERHYHFDEGFLKLTDPVYIKGFWQSEKYFENVRDLIRKEFTIKPSLLQNVSELAQEMSSTDSVSVHIRRGDYMNPVFSKYHGILSKEDYYDPAIREIGRKANNPRFYFFSDDMNWVKDTFDVDGAVYVSGKYSFNHYEDLYLMSMCKHNIIANSSFSWWAAWLNKNPGKIVIAPAKWFNEAPNNTKDLIPSGWIRL